MHKLAMAEIERLGRDASIPYYYVGDWTHTNDYGAYRAAGYAAWELKRMGNIFAVYKPLADAVNAAPGQVAAHSRPAAGKAGTVAAYSRPPCRR